MIILYSSGDTANERRGFGKEAFHYSAVHVKIVFFSPEMLKIILAVIGLFVHILTGDSFLLNN